MKAMVQGVSNAFSTFGWLPSNDGGSLNATSNYGTATISAVAIQNNTMQITFSGATNQFAPGSALLLTGLTTNTFLNNQIVRITNVLGSQSGGLTSTATNFTLTSVASSVGSTAVYTGTGFSATDNFYSGVIFVIAGFTNGVNNGTFVCTASSSTTITLYNSAATAETTAATATPQPDRTNTTFNALFTHADVGTFASPTADTGTITATYGYTTITNVPDRNDNGYTIKQPKKFRGAYVPVTPVFTQLQTTNNLTTLTFGANGHGCDLTRFVGLGLRITNVQNASFTWLNDASAPTNTNTQTFTAGWPIVSLTSTTIVINTSFSPRADIAATPVTAGFAAPYYVGGNADNTVSVNDLVLYNGDLYEFVNTTAGGLYGFQGTGGGGSGNGSGTGALPGADTSKWKRIWYELWTSNDSLSSTNKMYIRIQWGSNQQSLFLYLWFNWGTASDGSGNITQNSNWGSQQAIATSAISSSASNPTGAALWESDFSGDSGSFRMLLWRGYAVNVASPCVVFNVERSRDNNGNATDAYWTVVYAGSGTANAQGSILKPGTGGAGVLEFNDARAIKTIPCINGQSFNNSIPILPVFPMVGFVANPMIGVVAFKGTDVNEGGLITASLYGTSHTYLVSKQGNAQAGGPANFGSVGGNGTYACGIRWE